MFVFMNCLSSYNQTSNWEFELSQPNSGSNSFGACIRTQMSYSSTKYAVFGPPQIIQKMKKKEKEKGIHFIVTNGGRKQVLKHVLHLTKCLIGVVGSTGQCKMYKVMFPFQFYLPNGCKGSQ